MSTMFKENSASSAPRRPLEDNEGPEWLCSWAWIHISQRVEDPAKASKEAQRAENLGKDASQCQAPPVFPYCGYVPSHLRSDWSYLWGAQHFGLGFFQLCVSALCQTQRILSLMAASLTLAQILAKKQEGILNLVRSKKNSPEQRNPWAYSSLAPKAAAKQGPSFFSTQSQ